MTKISHSLMEERNNEIDKIKMWLHWVQGRSLRHEIMSSGMLLRPIFDGNEHRNSQRQTELWSPELGLYLILFIHSFQCIHSII